MRGKLFFAWAFLASLSAVSVSCERSGPITDRLRIQLFAGSITDVYVIDGVPRWRVVPYIWVDKRANVTCPNQDVTVYSAKDLEVLKDRIKDRIDAGCGLLSFLSSSKKSCVTYVSPFDRTYLAVVPNRKTNRIAPSQECTVVVSEEFSGVLLATAFVGALLFWYADTLSNSFPFRLSAGTLTFMLLSILILIFMVSRVTPNKKGVAATVALFGSSALGFFKFLFGRWIPTWQQLWYNKFVWGYVGMTGCIGAAITYYRDDPTNVKFMTLLRVALQGVGLALVFLSSSMPEASAAIIALLVATQWLSSRFGWPRAAGELAELQAEAQSVTGIHLAGQTAAAGQELEQRVQPAQQQKQTAPRQAAGWGWKRGPQHEGEAQGSISRVPPHHAPRAQAAASAALPLSRFIPETGGGALDREVPDLAGQRRGSLPGGPSGLEPRHHEGGFHRVEHEVPDLGREEDADWEAQSGRTLGVRQHRMLQQASRRALPGDKPLGGEEAGGSQYEPQPSNGQASEATRTMQSAERGMREEPSHMTPVASTRREPQLELSPLYVRGLLLNEETGKTIKVDGPTYNKLLVKGYMVDTCKGTITPPHAGRPAASTADEGSRSNPARSTRRQSASRGNL